MEWKTKPDVMSVDMSAELHSTARRLPVSISISSKALWYASEVSRESESEWGNHTRAI
jgi:hypothetical protein